MGIELQESELSVSETLVALAGSLPEEHITVRGLLAAIGEKGMLFFCIILTIPFLTPIPLPGVSTVFGALIMLVAIGVVLNRVPWLPGPLLNRKIDSKALSPVLQSGAQLFRRFERLIFPRLPVLTHGPTLGRLNGIMLFLGGALLILPFPMIPLSNMLPGYAILFLSLGMLQRDGLFVLLGYVMVLVSFAYFAAWAIAVIVAGQSISTLFKEPTPTPQGFIWLLWLR